jgi:hypothetical protein
VDFPDWTGQAAYVVAAGQSAADIVPNIPRGHCRVIAVNASHTLVPWADALYAADLGFWHQYESARKFAGRKYSCAEQIAAVCSSVMTVTVAKDKRGRRTNEMMRDEIGVIGGGENGGFQAVNLAVQFNANPIYLVGLDYCGKHWHPDHSGGLRNPDPEGLVRWAKLLDAQAPVLEAWGFKVINLSWCSRLTRFENADGRLPYPHRP